MGFVVNIAIIVIGIYALIIALFAFGWKRLNTFINHDQNNLIPISIVIACRNEEKNILSLLKSLTCQTYPKEKTEVIIVNDHSTDNTRDLISKYIADYQYIHLTNLPKKQTGKKDALAYGIKIARSNVLITTDADCKFNPHWIMTMVQYYLHNKPQLLAGPVTFADSKNIFHKLQTLEFLSLIGSGAGAIGINRAIMCNGANLLFEKSLYENSNPKRSIVSGDDIFLLLHAKKIDKKSIHFIKSTKAIVYTKPINSIKDFFQQRIRWTSKSKTYTNFDVIFTAIFVALSNAAIVASFLFSLWNHSFFILFGLLLGIKSLVDILILIPVSSFFHQRNILWLFIPLQFIYPFYIVFTIIFGFIGNFSWKGRKFKEKR